MFARNDACFWLTVGEVGAGVALVGEAVTSSTATALPVAMTPLLQPKQMARVVGTSVLFLAMAKLYRYKGTNRPCLLHANIKMSPAISENQARGEQVKRM